jgi:hypothetical protein
MIYCYLRTGDFVTVNSSSCQPYDICSDATINIGQHNLILVAFASETELSQKITALDTSHIITRIMCMSCDI